MHTFQRKNIFIALFLVILMTGSSSIIYDLWNKNRAYEQERQKLTELLHSATEEKKEATITRRVSVQLEEIAYQQKEISDIQRQEAIHQTAIADQMREHAEMEREKALDAQAAAIIAYNQMEEQKKLAELRQKEAVEAQMKADTLARLALGRSLGSQSTAQYAGGNKDLAALLAYTAWKFTSENQGDIYQPVIFDALSVNSNLSNQWRLHKGGIRDIHLLNGKPNNIQLISCSQYGEIFLWEKEGSNSLTRKVLFSNPAYDFRKIQIDNRNRVCVLSYNGTIVVLTQENAQLISCDTKELTGMEFINDQLFISSRNNIYAEDAVSHKFKQIYTHPHPITVFQKAGNELLIGDTQGSIHLLNPTSGKTSLLWNKKRLPVTAILWNPEKQTLITGYKNGLIVIGNIQTKEQQELVGHLSQITHIATINKKIITSSYDGSIRLWSIDNTNKAISSIVSQPSEWLHCFVNDPSGEQIFAGDEKGGLHQISISPEQMAMQIKEHLPRNFTTEEWEYYIGELSTYETFK